MRVAIRLMLAAALLSGCGAISSSSSEGRGSTRARFTGAVLVKFTNATPDRMCGLYMSDDAEDDYGDNWLPEAGVPSGGSVEFRVKPGNYKARWDTCPASSKQPFYAATMWREQAIKVERSTQLYAYIADSVAPTKRAAVMGRDFNIVRFPGQSIAPLPPQGDRPDERSEPSDMALRPSPSEPAPIAGFIGRVPLNAEMAAQVKVPEPPAPKAAPAPVPPPAPKAAPVPPPAAKPAAPAPAPTAKPAAPAPAPTAKPAAPAPAPTAKPAAPAPTAKPAAPAPTAKPAAPAPAPTAKPPAPVPAPTAKPAAPAPAPAPKPAVPPSGVKAPAPAQPLPPPQPRSPAPPDR